MNGAGNRQQEVLDPRVAYLMTQLLQGVIQSGTGAGVRGPRVSSPGCRQDRHVSRRMVCGYTSNLLCIVWVGFDNNQELPLSGSRSALPIWTKFMKRAASLPQYQDMVAFPEPPGLTWWEVDPVSVSWPRPSAPSAVRKCSSRIRNQLKLAHCTRSSGCRVPAS